MFKRANKITSLLVAAAAVVSLVPASASDVKKIDSVEETVYNAVAYKDGTAIIDGEIDDNDSTFYYADGKYTEIEDLDSEDSYSAYGEKYVQVGDDEDASDNDYVDLETGKVDDTDIDLKDDAASALRKEMKDVDRYGNDNNTVTNDELTVLPGAKFADTTWFTTKAYTIDTTDAKYVTGGNVNPSIYTDLKGNYIDGDYAIGKIKVEATGSGTALDGTVTLDNTVDVEKIKDGNDTLAEVTAKIDSDDTVDLGQDKDYIYRYAEITITVTNKTDVALPTEFKVNGKLLPFDGSSTARTKTLKVIQKISKTQDSSDVEDAKYSSSVDNYVISTDAAKLDDSKATNYADLAKAHKTDSTKKVQASLVSGKLAITVIDTDKNGDTNVWVQTAKLTSKNGWYYTDIEDQTDATAEFDDVPAADFDVDGNTYIVEDGYIKEFDGTDDWTKVYKVDGSTSALSVYDKDNMVAWDEDDDSLSIIGGKSADEDKDKDTTATDTNTTPVVTAAGWTKAADGTWSFVKADGTKAIGWYLDGATYYYLKADGVMATGWVQDTTNGSWYYLATSGAMQTGWVNDNGTWYYCNASGAMLANTTVDGYVLGANGAWVK